MILSPKNLKKLEALKNQHVIDIVQKYIDLCTPAKVTILTDTKEDNEYVRWLALKNKEELRLQTPGHTFHFDGPNDQGRDKEKTKVLLPENSTPLSKYINVGDRDSCLSEIFSYMKGIMKGREMLVAFYCLGPVNSRFSIPALQITDSSYVIHSENLLYRQGYKEFQKLGGGENFFHFIHAQGELENGVSKNSDKKRIYIDLQKERVFSVNTQYAGNSIGLKKLALRLAIKKSNQTDWLCEHMFLMGAKPRGKKRVTYFAGAFPSACGKTSTAMISGQTIIGDDIAYIKAQNGTAFAVNVEQGIFGIITDINKQGDPVIYKSLTSPKELIFSNVLVAQNKPFWHGMGQELPKNGINPDSIFPHKNARYTLKISDLPNADSNFNNFKGVPVSGVIYGGRDSDTSPPVVEAFNWSHGVFMGAAIESETTSATIGQEGVRVHNPMANLDFLVIPLNLYINNHLKFGKNLKNIPLVFTVNYFLKEQEKFLTEKTDKKVWLMWMEGRVHGEYEALETPIGYIPLYEDLKYLFENILHRDYTKSQYEKQFAIRTQKLLDKLNRIGKIFRQEKDIPDMIFLLIEEQRKRLLRYEDKYK